MRKILIAATLVGAFATPALAMDSFYIVFDNQTKKCTMARSAPTDTEKFSMMGIYGSEADAHMAMKGMMACR